MSRPDASGDTEMIRFRYDSGGHRIGKDSGVYHASYSGGEAVYAGETTRTSYSYLGDTLTQVRIVEPNSSATLHFTYDEIGPMSVTYDGAEYFYLKNAQGDVTGLVNSSGTQVVAYTYDAWGNPLTTTGSMAGTLGKLNPFRYRGYVYDTETGLYYLGSRYYNPQWGRFVNADSESLITASPKSVTWDKNLFAYCDSNPVVRIDSEGHAWNIIIGAVVGGITSGGMSILTSLAVGEPIDWGLVAIDAISGAVGGALTAVGAKVIADAVCEGVSNYAIQKYEIFTGKREEFDHIEWATSTALGIGYGKYADTVSDPIVKPLKQTKETAMKKTSTYVSKAIERNASKNSSSYYTKRAVKNTAVKKKASGFITAVKSFFSSLVGAFKPF